MDLTCEEMIDRLRLAHELVRDETEQLAGAGAGDHRATLWRLGKMVRNHQELANNLLIKMMDQGAAEEVLQEAEELAGFFNRAVDQIEAMLGPGRG